VCVKIVAECKEYVLLEAVAIQDAQDRVFLFIQYLYPDETRPEIRKKTKEVEITSSPTQIPLCAVVIIEITCSNACRNAGILSIEIFLIAEVIRETSRFHKKEKKVEVSGTLKVSQPLSLNLLIYFQNCTKSNGIDS